MPALNYPHIQKVAGQPASLERLPRIRVSQIVLDHTAYGWDADNIVRQYPHLRLAEVHAALAYYYDHQEEIDAENAADLEEFGRLSATESVALRERLLAAKEAFRVAEE